MAFVVPGALAGERGRPAGLHTERRIGIAFRKQDRDRDGRLYFGEWYRTRRGTEALPSKALELFRMADLNRNQRLSLYEFARSQGFRTSLPNSQSRPGGPGGSTQGATLSAGSSGGSNTTSGLPGGSSLTKVLGSTGGTLVISGAGGGNSSVTNSVSGTVSNLVPSGTLTLSTGGTTIGTLNPLALLTAPGTTDSSGNTLPGSGSLVLNGAGTFQGGNLTIGTLHLQTLPTGSGTTNSLGNSLPGSGSLTLSGGGTFYLGMLPLGTIQGGTLVISGTFSRYVGLTLEAARQLAESEGRASRVFSIDGVSQTVTADWKPSRVNLFLVDGIVKSAIGG